MSRKTSVAFVSIRDAAQESGASYEVVKDKESGALSVRPAELEEEDWGE